MKEYFNVKKVKDGVYHISDPINGSAMVCSTLILGNEKALLFDTGYGIGNLEQLDVKNRILFSGDSISSHVLMLLEESTSINTYIQSLKKVNELAVLVI